MRKRVTVRNPKTDSNSEFGCPNTAEERERCARGCSAKGQAKGCHVWTTCATRPELLSGHVWHTLATRGLSDVPLKVGQFCPSSSLLKWSLFPPIFHNLKNTKIWNLQNSSWFPFSYFDHIFFIRTRNRVIQKPKLLVSTRATNPKHFQRHLTSWFFTALWFPVRGQKLYVILLLLQFHLIFSMILSIWLLKYVEKYVRSYARVVWLIS